MRLQPLNLQTHSISSALQLFLQALIGDYGFHALRRQLLDNAPQEKWNYLLEQRLPLPLLEGTPLGNLVDGSELAAIPLLGSFHASDVILNWFGTLPAALSKNTDHLMGILVSFVHDLDPNNHELSDLPYWPEYNSSSRETIHLVEGNAGIIKDDFREEQIAYINQIGDFLRT
jgi:acetylcholinesterase